MNCLKLLPVVVLSLLITISCQEQTIQSQISDALEINVRNETVISHEDDHGGWLGDGGLTVVLRITDEATVNQIKEDWNPLPLTENMTLLIYGKKSENICPKFGDGSGNTLFPAVENGFYYFIDRHREAVDPFDDTDVLVRLSYNFTIAIFDADTNTLYYTEQDT